MAHMLDNPVWSALISCNKELCEGVDGVKYFASDVSPFVGFETPLSQALELLHDLVPAKRILGVVSPAALVVPGEWQVVQQMHALQMVQEAATGDAVGEQQLVPLGPEHVPAMLALTKSTNPGPFASNTIAFGHYAGIFDGNELVSMAGQRLHPEPYAEISAVCTHPDYLGRGYARQLLQHQAQRIRAAAGIPFLHVRADNTGAIKLYHSLGFATRKEMNIYIIQKAPASTQPEAEG
ncbi:GNAT family N-acetyltransferase [Hymenobacter sp. BT770]|uniref:GNAT family N-acetyltransferase n=1 Tax=Hymenobacter sp. BT770 TaxID=2886942 RepID=UPI001D1286D6|nr:GNAT family N-acetyltransferase [Hymenobacter sp. BT770]MCC3152738.1 GNAT family N-acetyltransferase [Hymenobacter sp. BT770]MDO3414811.1 GNAT family N-acetyltransferase [Hymenobacter sp. BT770]